MTARAPSSSVYYFSMVNVYGTIVQGTSFLLVPSLHMRLDACQVRGDEDAAAATVVAGGTRY